MPTLSSHPSLTVYEIHKNRIATIEPNYFDATPALQRLSIWGNALTELPSSLRTCTSLVGVQAQENKLTTIPAGAWPSGLETLFLQGNGPSFTLPTELGACKKLKRVNLGALKPPRAQNVCKGLKDKQKKKPLSLHFNFFADSQHAKLEFLLILCKGEQLCTGALCVFA